MEGFPPTPRDGIDSAMSRRFLCSLPTVTFALALLGQACASVTLYVDRNGNDSNPGTVARPLRSIEVLRTRIWEPGDAAYFRGGQTFTGSLVLPGGGSDSKPVVVGSYGSGGRATIDSAGVTLISGYNQGGFQFQD